MEIKPYKMAETKYELRSAEVQEVMNKPPHTFITWGNTIILLILAAALYIFNKVKLPIREQLPSSFVSFANNFEGHDTTAKYTLFSANITIPNTIKVNQKASMKLSTVGMEDIGHIPAIVDSFWIEKGMSYIILKVSNIKDGQLITMNGKVITPVKGVPMQIDITTREMNVWDYLIHTLFKI